MELTDRYNRKINNLRISLTPKCNLKCQYCHREGEYKPGDEMSAEDIAAVMQTAEKFSFTSIKLTGGEPTLRKDLIEIIKSAPKNMEVSMTTNGTLLAPMAKDLKAAGLTRVNISIDSLNPERYARISGKDLLPRVLEGIDAAIDAGLYPVKLNVVVLYGQNDDEIEDFIKFAAERPGKLIVQFIEHLDRNKKTEDDRIISLEEKFKARAEMVITRSMHHRRKYLIDGTEVEVVRPMHNKEFCAFCNRIRLTSDGKLKPCLLRHDNHVDVKGKRGEELEKLFIEAADKRKPFYN